MIRERPELFQAMLRSRFRQSRHYPLDAGYKDFLIRRGIGAAYSRTFVRRNRLCWRLGENAKTDWNALDASIQAVFGTNVGRTRLWLWLTRPVLAYGLWARPKFVCLNDDLGETPDPRVLELGRRFLQRAFPEPSPYEYGPLKDDVGPSRGPA